ncbi:hypothetical protein BH11PLA2_BH11PLA2_32830 [soil metagenome]
MIRVKTSISIRLPSGKFPPGSMAAVLEPCRQDLHRDVEEAFTKQQDQQTGRAWPIRKGLYPWPMLVKSGRMKERALAAVRDAAINGSTITLTMRSPKYSQFHISGTRFVAKRRFVGTSIQTRAALLRRLRSEGLKVFSTVSAPSLSLRK